MALVWRAVCHCEIVHAGDGGVACEDFCRSVHALLNTVEDEIGHFHVVLGDGDVEDPVPGRCLHGDGDVLAFPRRCRPEGVKERMSNGLIQQDTGVLGALLRGDKRKGAAVALLDRTVRYIPSYSTGPASSNSLPASLLA